MHYFVYIVQCADDTLYTGVTTDVARRIQEHNDRHNARGAKYTASRRPVVLVYSEKYQNRSEAMREEARIKKLSRLQKKKLIQP